MIASREGGYFQRGRRMGIGYHYLGGFDAQGWGQLFAFNFNGARNVSENHRRGTRPSGIMISRRPKRRASSEKAPGPSKTSAADIAARLNAVNALMWLFNSVIKDGETPV